LSTLAAKIFSAVFSVKKGVAKMKRKTMNLVRDRGAAVRLKGIRPIVRLPRRESLMRNNIFYGVFFAIFAAVPAYPAVEYLGSCPSGMKGNTWTAQCSAYDKGCGTMTVSCGGGGPVGSVTGDTASCYPEPTCSASGWTDVSGQNYQRMVSCSGSGCSTTSTTSYRCKSGYYGSSTSCSSCASATGNSAATSAAGSTAIGNCYLPAGTSWSDSRGSGVVAGNCHWN
jgi:hypothetical protein